MSSQCPYHKDHETRIENLEEEQKEHRKEISAMEKRIGSPALAVAIISFLGVCVTASAAFAGVIAAPVIQAVLKSWGLM